MSLHWPPQQNSCVSLSRYHPVATTIPHGCCSRDYHGDNPEVKGSVPGVGPPTMQAGSPGATLLPLRRLLFTSCHFRVAKWIKQSTKLNFSRDRRRKAKKKWLQNLCPIDYVHSAAIIGWTLMTNIWKFYLIGVTTFLTMFLKYFHLLWLFYNLWPA